jgi:hypothetical protein
MQVSTADFSLYCSYFLYFPQDTEKFYLPCQNEYPHLAEIINRLVFGVDFLLSARAYISSFTVYSPVSLKCKEANTHCISLLWDWIRIVF